jgi:hypothetical protein
MPFLASSSMVKNYGGNAFVEIEDEDFRGKERCCDNGADQFNIFQPSAGLGTMMPTFCGCAR